MPAYELTIALVANTSRRQTVEALKRVADTFYQSEGVIRSICSLGLRKLAYTIRHNKETHSTANYVVFRVHSSPNAMKTAQTLMRYDERVLRFLSLREDKRR